MPVNNSYQYYIHSGTALMFLAYVFNISLLLDSRSTLLLKRCAGNSVISPLRLSHPLPCCTRWLLHKDGKHFFSLTPPPSLTSTEGDSQPILFHDDDIMMPCFNKCRMGCGHKQVGLSGCILKEEH